MFAVLDSHINEGVKWTIPLRDTMHSLFSQTSIVMDFAYRDTSILYYLPNHFRVEAQNLNGDWTPIECGIKSTEDTPELVADFPSSILLNFFYFFLVDSTAFSACKNGGCTINCRVSAVLKSENNLYTYKTSNICRVFLPKPTTDELEAFTFFKYQIPEGAEKMPWLLWGIDEQDHRKIEVNMANIKPSILKDILSYYAMIKKFEILVSPNEGSMNEALESIFENEFGYLKTSKSEIVSQRAKHFFHRFHSH